MLRKIAVPLTISFAALVLSSCGSRSENVETAADAAGTASEESAPAGSGSSDTEEYADTEVFEGLITDIDGSIIYLSGDDGTTMAFDISGAEVYDEDGPLLRGSYAEADYIAEEGADILSAETFLILMDIEQQADIEERDPMIYGILQVMDTNELQILDDAGYERHFDNQISRKISFNDLKTGDEVAVTYAGSLLDTDDAEGVGEFRGEPYALKVVAIDALETEEAKADYITGTIEDIYEDGVFTIYTETVSLTIEADPSLYEGFEEGDRVRIYYVGQLSGMTVSAERVESAS